MLLRERAKFNPAKAAWGQPQGDWSWRTSLEHPGWRAPTTAPTAPSDWTLTPTPHPHVHTESSQSERWVQIPAHDKDLGFGGAERLAQAHSLNEDFLTFVKIYTKVKNTSHRPRGMILFGVCKPRDAPRAPRCGTSKALKKKGLTQPLPPMTATVGN